MIIIHWRFVMSCWFLSPEFKKGEHGTDKTTKMTVNFQHLTSHNGQEAPNSNTHHSKSLKSRYMIPARSKCSIHHTHLQYFSTRTFEYLHVVPMICELNLPSRLPAPQESLCPMWTALKFLNKLHADACPCPTCCAHCYRGFANRWQGNTKILTIKLFIIKQDICAKKQLIHWQRPTTGNC